MGVIETSSSGDATKPLPARVQGKLRHGEKVVWWSKRAPGGQVGDACGDSCFLWVWFSAVICFFLLRESTSFSEKLAISAGILALLFTRAWVRVSSHIYVLTDQRAFTYWRTLTGSDTGSLEIKRFGDLRVESVQGATGALRLGSFLARGNDADRLVDYTFSRVPDVARVLEIAQDLKAKHGGGLSIDHDDSADHEADVTPQAWPIDKEFEAPLMAEDFPYLDEIEEWAQRERKQPIWVGVPNISMAMRKRVLESLPVIIFLFVWFGLLAGGLGMASYQSLDGPLAYVGFTPGLLCLYGLNRWARSTQRKLRKAVYALSRDGAQLMHVREDGTLTTVATAPRNSLWRIRFGGRGVYLNADFVKEPNGSMYEKLNSRQKQAWLKRLILRFEGVEDVEQLTRTLHSLDMLHPSHFDAMPIMLRNTLR